jgi:hypothetical protein
MHQLARVASTNLANTPVPARYRRPGANGGDVGALANSVDAVRAEVFSDSNTPPWLMSR